jgi:nucleoside-diphosphate-sugar epimerase
VSSFSVYDYAAMPAGSTVDEKSPVHVGGRGAQPYAQVKTLQEQITRDWAARTGCELIVVRPGPVYGRNNVWTNRIGQSFGRIWLGVGSRSEVPATFVENCADAIVYLASFPDAIGQTYNILDAERPKQVEYRRLAASVQPSRPRILRVPWRVARASAAVVDRLNSRRALPLRLPGFVDPAVLDTRNRPLKYSNAKLAATGWRQPFSLSEAFERLSE